jgi:hypothetical protein
MKEDHKTRGEIRNTYVILVWKPEEKRILWASKRRFEDTVKTDHKWNEHEGAVRNRRKTVVQRELHVSYLRTARKPVIHLVSW